MSQRPRIQIAQQQRMALNTGLATAIRLLRSDATGLTRYLEEQAAENPHLRLSAAPPPEAGDWLPRWSGVLAYGSAGAARMAEPEAEATAPSLIAHVMAAVSAMSLGPRPRAIALALTEALEPSGWLGRDIEAIAQDTGTSPAEVEAVLTRLQDIDPPGLFARGLAECLRLQARDAGVLDRGMEGVLGQLELLARGDFARIARLTGLDEAGVQARFRLIRGFNPKPGTVFATGPGLGGGGQGPREPDLLARPLRDGRWQISLNRSCLPDIEVVPAERGSSAAEQARAARQILLMVKARNATLLRVGREIARRQSAALARGRTALQPMTMADVAAALELHPGTVSRVVAGATLDTPRGLWPLRGLFSGARGTGPDSDIPGPQVAAAALRQMLAGIIAAENPAVPLGDQELASQLAAMSGVRLARRTIAKYRDEAGIPPAHRRRKTRPHRAMSDKSGTVPLDGGRESP